MFDQLSASASPSRARLSPLRTFFAAAIHGAILMAAIRATTRSTAKPAGREVQVFPFMVAPVEQPLESSAESAVEIFTAAPQTELELPPVEFPTTIPPLPKGPPLESMMLRRAVEPGIGRPPAGSPSGVEAAVLASQTDDPASVLYQPSPRYPPVLQQAGLDGRVVLQFVIDTTGHVEPGSIRVLERTREGFDAAAIETLLGSLFRPGKVKGRVVRQLTVQAVVFRIGS